MSGQQDRWEHPAPWDPQDPRDAVTVDLSRLIDRVQQERQVGTHASGNGTEGGPRPASHRATDSADKRDVAERDTAERDIVEQGGGRVREDAGSLAYGPREGTPVLDNLRYATVRLAEPWQEPARLAGAPQEPVRPPVVLPEVLARPPAEPSPAEPAAAERPGDLARPPSGRSGQPADGQPEDAGNPPARQPADTRQPSEPDTGTADRWHDEPAERPQPGSLADLRRRLERLPSGHPSSPFHDDGTRRPPPPRLKHLELAPPRPDRTGEAARLGTAVEAARLGTADQAARLGTASQAAPSYGTPETAATYDPVLAATSPHRIPAASRNETWPPVTSPAIHAATRHDATPAATGQDAIPPATGQDAIPAPAGQDAIPARAGQDATLGATSQYTTRPAASQNATPPAASQNATPPAAGQDATPPATGQDATPAATSQDATPAATSLEAIAAVTSPEIIPAATSRDAIPAAIGRESVAAAPNRDGDAEGPNGERIPATHGEQPGRDSGVAVRASRETGAARTGGPRIEADGSWNWGSASLTPDQVGIARDMYDRLRAAEGRDLLGGYGNGGLTAALLRIEAQLEHGRLALATEQPTLIDPDMFMAELAILIRRHPGAPVEDLSRHVPGALSYAFVFDAIHYAVGTWLVHDALRAQGSHLDARKNAWSSAEHKCVVSFWLDSSRGVPFQVQFHTTESFEAKRLARTSASVIADPRTPPAEAARIRSELATAWVAVGSPPGISQIGDYRRSGR